MNHEYRESPYSAGICAGCGCPEATCAGFKRLPSFLTPQWRRTSDTSEWEAWCRRFGIAPNTPDETLLDDYLHGRTPPRVVKVQAERSRPAAWRDFAQCEAYAVWDAYDQAVRRMPFETRTLQARAEVCELERVWRR